MIHLVRRFLPSRAPAPGTHSPRTAAFGPAARATVAFGTLPPTVALVACLTAGAAHPAAAQSYAGASAAPAPSSLGSFGGAVAVAGDQILVGEPNNDIRPGTVYLYERAADGSWTEAGSFTAPDGEAGDGFGAALAVDGDRLLVGARGVAYEFERSGDAWSHAGTLRGEMVGEADAFGATVALDGDRALVGGPARGERRGAAWLFRRAASGWSQTDLLEPDTTEEDNLFFGAAVALHAGRAYVGVSGYDSRAGAVAVYELSDAGAERTELLQPDAGNRGDRFGSSIDVEGDVLAVGAPAFGGGMGIV